MPEKDEYVKPGYRDGVKCETTYYSKDEYDLGKFEGCIALLSYRNPDYELGKNDCRHEAEKLWSICMAHARK